MIGRSFARLLAPLALVVTAVALLAIVTSGGGDGDAPPQEKSPRPAATSTPTGDREPRRRRRERTYTVKPGDTPSDIAEAAGVSLEELLEANPDADPNALTPGERLRLPDQ